MPNYGQDYSLSVLQDFSAPAILKSDQTSDDALRLMGNDPNAFNRWEAGQTLARELLGRMTKAIETGTTPKPDRALSGYVRALNRTLNDDKFDNNFKALALTIPFNTEIQQSLSQADPIAVDLASKWLLRAIGDGMSSDLLKHYQALKDTGTFSPVSYTHLTLPTILLV